MKSKILIENVLMPSDSLIKNINVFEALRRRGCSQSDINYIRDLIRGKDVYDFSGYSGITTLIIPGGSKDEKGYCIKISDVPGELKENYILCNLMARYQLSSKVVRYISSNKDYLITEQIEAPMAINVFKSYRQLSKFMGESLRKYHDIEWDWKQMTREELEVLQGRTNSMISKAVSHKNGLRFLAQYQNDMDYDSMREYILQHKSDYISDEVIIHGDYNPRNVLVRNNNVAAMVDFEDTCFGDRHYDIYFSMWTVALYSGIVGQSELVADCENVFLEAYGKDKIDNQRLEFCKRLTCMYWQEHNDIKTLI